MHRPPIACRRAVQSLRSPSPQHVWISDDILAHALNRVFPSSCPLQKRHGSHVPGPLEARRRAAKRRMTVSAGFCPQENLAPLFNLSALFGLRKDAQPTWRYEAPSLQTHVEPQDSPQHVLDLPIPQVDRSSTKHAASTIAAFPFGVPYPFSQNAPRAKPQEHVSGSGEHTVEVVDAAAHFDDFKTKIANAGTLSRPERSQLLHHTWMSCRPIANNAWVYNVMVIKYLTDHGWDHTRILSNLKYFQLPPLYTPDSLQLLKCLETSSAYLPHASRVHRRIYLKMVEAATLAAPSTSSIQDTELLALVRLTLRNRSPSTKARQSAVGDLCILADKIQASVMRGAVRSALVDTSDTKHNIMVLIARSAHGHHLHAVHEVLSLLPEGRLQSLVPSVTRSLIQVVGRKSRLPAETHCHRVRAWMTVLGNFDAQSDALHPGSMYTDMAFAEVAEYVFKSNRNGIARPLVLLYALAFRVAQQPTYAECKNDLLQCVHVNTVSSLEQQRSPRMEEELVKILSRLQAASFPYEPVTSLAIHLFASHASLRSLYKFHHALEKYQLPLDNISAIQTRIASELSSLRQQTHSRTIQQRERHAFTLHACQTMTDSLKDIAGPSVSTALVSGQEVIQTLQARQEFAAILERASDYRAMPLIYADLTPDISFAQRTFIIHQLAHHYSIANTRSYRATWRSIYQLYKYLDSYSLPIGPLFSKAVVRAAIIRPMMEYRFISARILIWVCQLVARVEGEQASKKIELTFWHWRGGLIKHTKDVHVAAGGDRGAKAIVAKLKQLNMFDSNGD